jgi:hypothetical protein
MRPSVVRVFIAVSVLALCLSGVALGVSLSRSNSPVTTAVQVPNLLGRRQVVATGILGGLGLRYRVVTLLFGNGKCAGLLTEWDLSRTEPDLHLGGRWTKPFGTERSAT